MGHPFEANPEFQRLLARDESVDLTRLVLELARDAYPELNTARYLARIDELAERIRDRCPDGMGARQILGQINWVLFVEERFQGNDEDYYDPRNSYLNEVIDRRKGIPISLSVLYLALADRLGLAMAGVNLPAHFVVRLRDTTTFVDPFHNGKILDRAGCARRVAEVIGQDVEPLPESALAPCGPRIIVLRMLRNLKATYLQRQDFEEVLPVLRRLVALEESDVVERRDLGMVCMHADRPGEAVGHLEAYLTTHPDAEDAGPLRMILRAAWRDLARRN